MIKENKEKRKVIKWKILKLEKNYIPLSRGFVIEHSRDRARYLA